MKRSKVALALQLGGTERNTRKSNIRATEECRKKKTILRILKSGKNGYQIQP